MSYRPHRKRSVKDVYGPVRPRLDRFRTKSYYLPRGSVGYWYSCIQPGRVNAGRTWNAFYDTPHYLLSTWWCKDTIPNPKFNARYPLLDNGGEFWLRKSWWQHRPTPHATPGWAWGGRWYGAVPVHILSFTHEGLDIKNAELPPIGDKTDVQDYGPTGWARAKPDQPYVDLGEDLAQMYQITDVFHRVAEVKDLANYFLGIEFGWAPILDDLKRCLKFIDKVEGIVSALKRNNGLPVRRRARILQSIESERIYHSTGNGIEWNMKAASGLPASLFGHGFLDIQYRKTRNIWFSGEFITWIDDIDAPGTDVRLTSRLLGLYPSPKLAWDLVPWSFLIDWVGNIGASIENATTTIVDRQVSTYAYVMGSTLREYTWTGQDGPFSASSTHYFETKVREPADKYGLKPAVNLSDLQEAILIALGLQRLGS